MYWYFLWTLQKKKRKYIDHDRIEDDGYPEQDDWPGYEGAPGNEDGRSPNKQYSDNYEDGDNEQGYSPRKKPRKRRHTQDPYDDVYGGDGSPPGPYDSPYGSPPGPYDSPSDEDHEYRGPRGGNRWEQWLGTLSGPCHNGVSAT